MHTADLLASGGILLYLILFTIALGGWFCTVFIYNCPRNAELDTLQAEHSISVSILRPMRGLEPMLEECLASVFRSTYTGDFEIILSVADEDDPAVEIARKVMRNFPRISSNLIIGDVDIGVNPKINNLVRSFGQARYSVIWVLDSNCWVSSGTLQRSAAYFANNKVNLVHHIPVAHSIRGSQSGARLDDIYMGTMHAKMYSIINYFNVAPCVMGKSNLFRKSALGPDGLKPYAKYIAEDHLIATALWHGRGSHVLGIDCVRQPLDEVSFTTFAKRRIRWVRVRKYMVTASTLIEPVTECFGMGVLGCSSIAYLELIGLSFTKMFTIHVLTWFVLDYCTWVSLHRLHDIGDSAFNADPGTKLPKIWPFVWLFRETSAFPLWLVAIVSDKIEWRGTQFVIARDMTARRVS